jgi:ribosomal protein S18 acetylase RimI-like enzyme
VDFGWRLHPKSILFADREVEVFMTTIIRDALAPEGDRVALLAVGAYQEYAQSLSQDNWEIMRTNLSNIGEVTKVGKLIVATCDDLEKDSEQSEVIGAVIYCPPGHSDPKIFQSEWASLKMLSVDLRYRGRGIGAQLCRECIDRARQDNAEIIALHTSELMLAARSMYAKLGFELDTELPPRLGLRYWRYVMEL